MFQITIPIETNLPQNGVTDLGLYLSRIAGVALTVAAVATFVYLVWGGVEWITAGGDKGKTESARNRITGAIIGLAITAASWAIFAIVDHLMGLGIAR